MHYANGKPAKVGDIIVVKNAGIPFTGVVVEAIEGSTSCNLKVVPITATSFNWVTASDAVYRDDVLPSAPAANPPANP